MFRGLILAGCAFSTWAQSPPEQQVPTFGTTVVVSGELSGDIYILPPGTRKLPKFKKKKPVGTIYTDSLNVPTRDFRDGFPGVTTRIEWFAIDYHGRFWIEKPGEYGFRLRSDDGSILYIDDRMLINNDGIHPPTGKESALDLDAGIHNIRVSYFQGPRWQVSLILWVKRPGETWRIFSTREFSPPGKP